MKRFYIIDGNNYLHRAFHALPLMINSSGQVVNAVYGLSRMLMKLIRQEKPDYIAVAFDHPSPTFRHQRFRQYKAQRKPVPEELKEQIPLAHQLVKAFGIATLEKEGFEADDIAATLARYGEREGIETIIVTGDKDALQLVTERVKILDEPKNILYDIQEVHKKLAVEPGQVVEVMALTGDATDNIPGARGIGEKTAVKLIQQFGTIKNLYQNLNKIGNPKLRDLLAKEKDAVFLSRELVILKTDVPLKFDWEEFKLPSLESPPLVSFFRKMGFGSLLKEVVSVEDKSTLAYHCVRTRQDFLELEEKLKNSKSFSLALETTSVFPMEAEIIGISLAFRPREAWYIPLGHRYLGAGKQLEEQFVLEKLRPLLEDEQIPKDGQNLKELAIILARHNIKLCGIGFDPLLADYLLNPAKQNHNLAELAIEYLGIKPVPREDLIGKSRKRPEVLRDKGKQQTTLAFVEIEKLTPDACAQADIVRRLKEVMGKGLEQKGLDKLFKELELPLAKVLAEMELNGVKIDTGYLADLSKEFQVKLTNLESQIYKLSGEEFNINSPRQVAEILFEKLKLPSGKHTKTGYSTREDVLVKLAAQHELPARILEYRELQKLKSTYIDALPKMVNSVSGRVHADFNQTGTVPGRLSSSDPNLQNIPVRTELGQRIRKAFIAEAGNALLSFDYSQIDLRVLAHISKDTRLCKAFSRGEDIHQQTAAEVFGVGLEQVTPQLRKSAKAINFGIVYGMSAYGLSQRLGISREEATRYIEGYFKKYSGVKKWTAGIIRQAREKGYVTTLLNRRRYLPEINSRDGNQRAFAERTAINTPIQGSAADLIKLAMINISRRLQDTGYRSSPKDKPTGQAVIGHRVKMLIQVHDELLFEVPEEEIGSAVKLIKFEMENALKLDVPITVDVKVGKNWAEMQELGG